MPDTATTSVEVSATPSWRLQLCGPAQLVSTQDERIALERRDAAMLALLAIEGPTARSRVMELLWPDEAPEQVRGRLRQRIYALKRKLGGEAIEGSITLTLGAGLVWPGFEHEPLGAPLLGADDHADLPEFSQWLSAARSRLQNLWRERLASEASLLEQQGRVAEAIVSAEQLLALEPLQEHAHRRLMRLHYLRGDRAAALLAFDRCEQLLKDEVGATPSAETLELLAQIERSQALASMAGPTARRVVPASVMRPPRLIGRDAEWAQLQAAWERGDAIVVVGEAGMGKTRLVGDLVRAHATAPGSALQVSARPGDERVPYALLSRLLRGLLAMRSAPLPKGIATELARLLPELPQPTKTSSTSDAAAQARFVGAIEATLRQGIESGLQAVVLDDLHFADAASLDMAQHLSATPVRWLAAFRGSEIGAAGQALVDTLTASLHAEPVVLQPLTAAQVAELIDSLSLDTRDTAALAGALHQRTAGNPLFALETLKSLLQQGGTAHAAASPARALAQLPAGGSVGRLIERRIGQLSREAVNLARCAAIAGQDFSAALASQVMHTPAIALADAWVELETAQVLRGHAFAHDLIEEAALASVPGSIAKHLHGEVAAWLASQSGEPARVAHHWQQAVLPEHAGPAWLEAAERCAASRRRAEQAQMLARAAAAFEQAGDRHARCDALLRRAKVVGQYADFESAKRAIDEAERAVVDDAQRLRLAVVSVCAQTLHGEDDYALARAPAALEMAQRLGLPHEGLLVSMAYGGALARSGRAGEAVKLLMAQRPWVDAHASADQRRDFWNAVALALDYGSRMRESMQAWQTAREWAERDGSDLLCQVIGNMAYTSAKMGEVEHAAELGAQALNLARSASDGFDDQVLHQQLALGHHLRNLGRYSEAVPLLESAAAGFRGGGRDLKALAAEYFLAVAWVQLGQPARALQLTSAEEPSPLPRMRSMRLAFRALALQATGQDALAAINEAFTLLNEPELLWFRTHALIATAIVPASEGEPIALELASWAIARERFGLALAAHARAARCALALGAAERAWPHLQTALQFAKSYQPDVFYLPELWWVAAQVHEALGRHIDRRNAIADGARWITRVAQQHVPAELRESFLHRNGINADLLRWERAINAEPQ